MTIAPRESPSDRPVGAITNVKGIEVGHHTDARRPTGCTVIIARDGAVAGVDVRGAAPGTRETDLLQPSNLVQQVHAIVLSGGSAFGLDTAGGVMKWLEEHDIGLPVHYGRVPIVPAAVLFDLGVGDHRIRPDADAGYAACEAASNSPPILGNVGAGAGALVGKAFGMAGAMKGGIGSASLDIHGVTVGAIVACNALGDVIDPNSGVVLAGARPGPQALTLRNTRLALLAGEAPTSILDGTNTTIGVVATDAIITKGQADRIAQVAHDGLARAINPVHTMSDGDTIFSMGTGKSGKSLDMLTLAAAAAEVTALAVVQAILAARGLNHNGKRWPAACDLKFST